MLFSPKHFMRGWVVFQWHRLITHSSRIGIKHGLLNNELVDTTSRKFTFRGCGLIARSFALNGKGVQY